MPATRHTYARCPSTLKRGVARKHRRARALSRRALGHWACGAAASLVLAAAGATLHAQPTDAAADDADQTIVWATGERDASGPPEGYLLSDNAGYWGDSVLTGVEYHYESDASNPSDTLAGDSSEFGWRLLDGRVGGNWHVPVGENPGRPLVVVFDFKRPATFTEVNTIATRTPRTSLKIEVRDSPEGAWETVYDQALEEAEEQPLKRAKLSDGASGRYMRLSIGSDGITYVDEVAVWGDAEVSEEYPEHIAPTYDRALPEDTFSSLPAMRQTRFSHARFEMWRDAIGTHAAAPAVWAHADEPSPGEPVLPGAEAINAPLEMVMARNETESRYLTLTNTSMDDQLALNVEDIELHRDGEPANRLDARLLIGGALPATPPEHRLSDEQRLRLMMEGDTPPGMDMDGDVRVLPFFDQGQMLGESLMHRHVSNGAEILDYPRLTLPPGGAAVFMLRVISDDIEPGTYTGTIAATTDAGDAVSMDLTVEVADITLPEMDIWVRAWGNGTDQFPYETQTRRLNDARVNREVGATVWTGFPTPGSKPEHFGSFGTTHYRVHGIPSSYVHRGYAGSLEADELTEEDEAEIVAHLEGLVAQAQSLGLDYDEWFVELWDEPQEKNVELFGALARIIHETDPNVRIYMNPLFWRPGFAPQEVIVEDLDPYYNDLIDISVPISGLVGDNLTTRELWSQPRFVNAFFIHPPSRGGRAMAWKAFDHGFNGWGYYCYYAPRGNPWDIRTWSNLSYTYQMVFPGPNGPIIMPIYETMRDGWEDYRLLTALRESGREPMINDLLEAYHDDQPLTDLRRRALQAVIADE